MDKGLLLVLLCLQVVLLTTAFTSAHEAALLRDDQRQQQQPADLVRRLQQVSETEGEEVKIRVRRSCGSRPGGCGSFRRPPPTKPSLTEIELELKKPSGVFTSAHEAALLRDDQRQQQQPVDLVRRLQQVTETEGEEVNIKIRRSCGSRPGGCGIFVRPSPSQRSLEKLKSQLKKMKASGVKLCRTCHTMKKIANE